MLFSHSTTLNCNDVAKKFAQINTKPETVRPRLGHSQHAIADLSAVNCLWTLHSIPKSIMQFCRWGYLLWKINDSINL